ncbi:SCY1-like protein 2 [Oppia nitens]|uniref:SCY1-like protein 2 n=1 Tax=Oppia nitens TaxID=1686743 RepID=UPI0023DCD3A2|nr:SCY1-like protein 2 [Oppia nitens]
MFSKLKSSTQVSGSYPSPVDLNPICQYFEIGKQVASAGPELAWKIFDANRKTDKKEASVFFFDKRVAEKLHKPKRKETIAEILRFSVRQLDRLRHPKMLTLLHSVEESSDTLAFATEPVMASLANILGTLDDRLPQHLPKHIREYTLLDFEIKYGLLQITEALLYLHYSCKLIHRNVCPQSVIINKRGTWKLAGLEFTEKCADGDLLSSIAVQSYTSKLPKMAQPDLDYTAPEVQSVSSCSTMSDMFSLGLLITSLYNNRRSLMECNLNGSHYSKQLDSIEQRLHEILDHIPHHLQDPLQGLLEIDPRRRPNSQNFSMIKYFMDSGVHALQYLDVIQMKDSTHKSNFYHNLKGALSSIPKKMWWQHILPSMETELQSPEVLAAALQPIIYMIEESSVDEYQDIILPFIRNIFLMPKSVQATVTLLENIDILIGKTAQSDLKTDVLPMLYASFDSSTPQIQCAALSAVAQVIDHLDDNTIRKMVLPKTKQIFENNCGVKEESLLRVQANALICVERVIDNLDKTEILDDVLPMLSKAKLYDPFILMPVIRMYKHMLGDKRYGLTNNLLANKVMPTLIPAVVSPTLKLDEFNQLMELLTEMLEHVAKSQRNKIKLEKHIPSQEKVPPPPQQHTIEQPIGYPHRPPSLRLESRRTSISMDDVVRRTSSASASSSPDSNLLRVQANLPGRRHSDNTIQPPRILVAPSSPTGSYSLSRGPSASNLHMRRHSSVGPQDPKFSFLSSTTHKPFTANLGLDSFLSGRTSGRRYSAVPTFNTIPTFHHSKNTSANLLQTIGTGVQQLFGK